MPVVHCTRCDRRAVTPAGTLWAPTHRRPRSSARGAAGGSGRAAPGTPLPRAGRRRCGVRPGGEQGSVSPSSPRSFPWGGIAPRSQSTSPNFPGGLTWVFPQAQPELWGQRAPVTCRVPLPWNCRGAEGPPRYSAQASALLSSCPGGEEEDDEHLHHRLQQAACGSHTAGEPCELPTPAFPGGPTEKSCPIYL